MALRLFSPGAKRCFVFFLLKTNLWALFIKYLLIQISILPTGSKCEYLICSSARMEIIIVSPSNRWSSSMKAVPLTSYIYIYLRKREWFGHMYMQVCLLKSTVEGQEMSVNYLKSTCNFQWKLKIPFSHFVIIVPLCKNTYRTFWLKKLSHMTDQHTL